ncbi:hypothetical protein MNBD_DELTA04-601 [hydrothermal vent metagenome]|uniref:Uncharacterized protein n=1 Tax=hydrothermal vent metagenome TaxID=652676 RepID=A0A3B0VCW8_9ZZZZ
MNDLFSISKRTANLYNKSILVNINIYLSKLNRNSA